MNTTDFYFVSANGSFSTDGYLYKHHFDAYNPKQNLYYRTLGYLDKSQFKATFYFQSNITYILIIAPLTHGKNVQGLFSILVYGSDRVSMKKIGKTID